MHRCKKIQNDGLFKNAYRIYIQNNLKKCDPAKKWRFSDVWKKTPFRFFSIVIISINYYHK
jgi:hypothetical protein